MAIEFPNFSIFSKFDEITINKTDFQDETLVAIPEEVWVKPFRIKFPEGAGFARTTAGGRIRVELPTYLAAVIWGEIGEVTEIGPSPESPDFPNSAQRSAIAAMARVSVNELLFKIRTNKLEKKFSPRLFVIPGGVPGEAGTPQTTLFPFTFANAQKAQSEKEKFSEDDLDLSKAPGFVKILKALTLFKLSRLRMEGIPVATLSTSSGAKPVNLSHFAFTSFGFTSDNNVAALVRWLPFQRAQLSTEYESSVHVTAAANILGIAKADITPELIKEAFGIVSSERSFQIGMSQKGMIALAGEGRSSRTILVLITKSFPA